MEGELVEVIPALAQKVASGPWPWEELRAKLNLEAAYACGPVWEEEQLKGKEEIVRPMLELLNFGSHQLSFLKEMLGGSSLKESRERLTKFVHKQVRAGVRHFAGFIGNDFIYTPISPLRLADIYQRPSSELAEANGLATYYLDAFLEAVGQAGGMAQFYLGSKWNLPGMENGESYPIVSHRLVPSLVTLFRRHPGTKVSIMNATAALGQELTVMARMLNNVSLAGFWWHALNPPYIRRQIEERLSLLPLNKWVLLTTDSYNLEWCYGKIALAIHCLAQVLARKIAEGDLGRKEALQIGKWLLYQAPSEIYER